MIFYCVEATAPGGATQNAWVTRKDEALRMARTFGAAAERTRVVRVEAHGKEQVAELLNVASGVVEVLTGGEVIWRSDPAKAPRKHAPAGCGEHEPDDDRAP